MDKLGMRLDFLIEIDKMKNVLRQSLLMDKSRRENDAEHSWHFAVMAMVLSEYASSENLNMERILKMALVHDLVEIYAGDTFAYDADGYESKAEREKQSADKIFSMLPEGQDTELRALWEEFERMESAESLYANAIDRFHPLLHNYMTGGHAWKLHEVSSAQVYKRMELVRLGAPGLWETVERIIREAVENGWLKE